MVVSLQLVVQLATRNELQEGVNLGARLDKVEYVRDVLATS